MSGRFRHKDGSSCDYGAPPGCMRAHLFDARLFGAPTSESTDEKVARLTKERDEARALLPTDDECKAIRAELWDIATPVADYLERLLAGAK